jgi:hypothetical protein
MKEPETAAFGAEALPGGLREINAERRGEPPPARIARPARRTPLVGLIALAARYFGWATTRK